MGLVAWLLWRWRDRFRPGMLFALYLVSPGLERFLVEFIRRNDEVVAGLTAPQLQSLAMMVAGTAWLALAARRQPSSRSLSYISLASQRRVSPWISASCCAERWSPPSSRSSRFGSAARS